MREKQEYCFQNFGEWTYAIPLLSTSGNTKEALALNPTAASILTMAEKNIPLNSIADKLSNEYQINYHEALKQVKECVNTWEKLKNDTGSGRISD